jgi:hypothetical protein
MLNYWRVGFFLGDSPKDGDNDLESIDMEVLNVFFLDLPNDKRTKHL